MTHEIKTEGQKFLNPSTAVLALMNLQLVFTHAGHLVKSYIMLEHGRCELTVHFDLTNPPIIPDGYKFSQKVIHSHDYYSDIHKSTIYVRKLDIKFKW